MTKQSFFVRAFTQAACTAVAVTGAACGSTAALPDSRTDTPDASGDTGVFIVIDGPANGSTVGYQGANAPPAIKFSNGARPTQCRSGHVPDVDSLQFAACPSPAANGEVTYVLAPTSGKSDGAYRIDIKHADADGSTGEFALTLHVSRSLTGATACGPGTAGWPTDEAWFTGATSTIAMPADRGENIPWVDQVTHRGTLPHADVFTGISLVSPFYSIPFADVNVASTLLNNGPADYWNGTAVVKASAAFTLPIVSLRHRLVANADNTLVLIHRTYESRAADRNGIDGVCTINLQVGNANYPGGLDWSRFACDALVVNRAGEGVCLTRAVGGAPQIAMFSRTMVFKLTDSTSPIGYPKQASGVFGPKVVDSIGAYPDAVIETAGPPRAVIVRP